MGKTVNYQRVDHAIHDGTWSTINSALDTGGTAHYHVTGCILGESDKVHLVWNNQTDEDVEHRSLTSAYVLAPLISSEPNVVNDSAIDSTIPFNGARPVYYDSSGVERITSVWKEAIDDDAYSSEIDDDGTPSAEEQVSATNIESPGVRSLAVNGKTVHLFVTDTSQDLYESSNVDGAGWSTLTLVTTGTFTDVSSNVYVRDGRIVLAYIYNNGGAQYDEIDLGAAPVDAPFLPYHAKQRNKILLRM